MFKCSQRSCGCVTCVYNVIQEMTNELPIILNVSHVYSSTIFYLRKSAILQCIQIGLPLGGFKITFFCQMHTVRILSEGEYQNHKADIDFDVFC